MTRRLASMRPALALCVIFHAITSLGQPAGPAIGSSPYSAADIVAGLLSSPVTSANISQDGLPANLNSSNPAALAPAPAVMLAPTSNFTCSDLLVSSEGQLLSADTDAFVNAHRFVLQSLVYPLGISMDTLQANYSMVSGVDKFITLNRFWTANEAAPSFFGGLLSVAGSGPASYLLGMQQRGFNMTTFSLLGNNRTVRGSASEVPASSLQPVQPQWNSSLTRLTLTVRAQGAAILPFTPALQRELVSALLHTAAPRGAVAIQVVQYAEAGGVLKPPEPFPDPPSNIRSRRRLRQAAEVPYADAQLQILSQSNSDTSAMLADLNSSGPSQIFTASGVAAILTVGSALQAPSPIHSHSHSSLQLNQTFISRVARLLQGTDATIVATSTLASVTPASQSSSSGGHSRGHTAAIAVPVVLIVALAACAAAGCVWWGKRGKRSGRQGTGAGTGAGAGRDRGQAVSKSGSGVPFNQQDLDSARGPGPSPEVPADPTQVLVHPSPAGPQEDGEPDHAPAGGVRIGPGRPQRSWLHRLTATPMITTNGQNWLQVMRSHAAHPGEGADPAADVHAASPVPQLRVTGLPGQNMEVDRVVARLRGRENEQHDALAPVHTFVTSHMQEGAVFKGKYSMQSHGWPGPAYVLCSGHRSALPQQHLSVKLFARGVDYLQEKALLETPTITLQEYLPGLFESYSACAGEGYGVTCPPCLLIHRPACTLEHWLSNARAEATTPAFSDKVSSLYNILSAVHSLHVHRVVHCDLHPIQFGWFNEAQQWKLLAVSSWAHTGSARSSNMTYTLRYAAPEVVQGDQSGKDFPLATPAADVWALGVIAYEVLCGQRLFEKDVNQAEVVSMLLGYTAMPFEANPALFQSINAPPNAQNMLRQMLQRNPSARPALKDVLSNSLFAGLSRSQRIQSEREHSQHQVWSVDFRSQMSNALDSLDSVDY